MKKIDYNKKYLKYKNKYIQLKNQFGGKINEDKLKREIDLLSKQYLTSVRREDIGNEVRLELILDEEKYGLPIVITIILNNEEMFSYPDIPPITIINGIKYYSYNWHIHPYLIKSTNIALYTYRADNVPKKIFPAKFDIIRPLTDYKNYLYNFINYLENNRDLDELKLIIGSGNTGSDIERFGRDYDIGITSEGYPYDINNPAFLSLLIDGVREFITENIENFVTLYSSVDIENIELSYYNSIYYLIGLYLSNKFIKIIYDFGTTSFIENIFSELELIKNLLKVHGILYIDTFGNKNLEPYWIVPSDGKFYINDLYLTRKINKNDAEMFTNDISASFYILKNGKEIKINNIGALILKMADDGGIDELVLNNHMEKYPSDNIDQKIIVLKTITKLEKVFPKSQFIINHINDNTYPNGDVSSISVTQRNFLKSYYKIIRIN